MAWKSGGVAARRPAALVLALISGLVACTAHHEAAPPFDWTRVTDPCQVLTDGDRTSLGLGPGEPLAGRPTDQIHGCEYQASSIGDTTYPVDALEVQLFDTPVELARTVLEATGTTSVLPSPSDPRFALVAARGIYQREITEFLSYPACDTLFGLTPSRAVRVVVTLQSGAASPDACTAAGRVAVVDGKIPAHPLVPTGGAT